MDARDELSYSEEAFNASQMNTNQQNIFVMDAAAADSSELDISGYDKKKKKNLSTRMSSKTVVTM